MRYYYPYLLLFCYCLWISSVSPSAPSALELDDVLQSSGFTDDEIRQVRDGKLVRGVVESTTDIELAVKFAFLVSSPIHEMKEPFLSSLHKKEADHSVTELGHFLNDDGCDTIERLSDLTLQPNSESMARTYLKASPGSDLNLSKKEIEGWTELNSKDGTGPKEVETHFREMLLERYRSYRKNGLSGIPHYARSNDKDYDPGKELRHKTEVSKLVKEYAPEFHKYLLDYPNSKPDGLEESFSWTNSKIDDKPTIALVHKMGLLLGKGYVFCERHYYVSRSHNSMQGLGGAFPVEGGNTVVLYVARTSTDQVAGFGGATKRSIGARVMGSKMAENFENARRIAAKYHAPKTDDSKTCVE